MARRVKNMGTATMRFNEGIIASGSIASPGHAFAPNVSMVCSGTLEFSAGTNIQKAIRIIGNDEDREISFQTTNPAAEVGKIHATPGMSLIVSGAESLDLQSGIVLINSGGAASSPDPTDFADTNFFVSGAVGSIGTSVKGTSVFGGDVMTSGSNTILNNLVVGVSTTASSHPLTVSGSAKILGDPTAVTTFNAFDGTNTLDRTKWYYRNGTHGDSTGDATSSVLNTIYQPRNLTDNVSVVSSSFAGNESTITTSDTALTFDGGVTRSRMLTYREAFNSDVTVTFYLIAGGGTASAGSHHVIESDGIGEFSVDSSKSWRTNADDTTNDPIQLVVATDGFDVNATWQAVPGAGSIYGYDGSHPYADGQSSDPDPNQDNIDSDGFYAFRFTITGGSQPYYVGLRQVRGDGGHPNPQNAWAVAKFSIQAVSDERNGYINFTTGSIVKEGVDGYGIRIENSTGDMQFRDSTADASWVDFNSFAVGGTDGQVQYNNGGVFGGAANLFYDDSNGRVGIGVSSNSPGHVLAVTSSDSGNFAGVVVNTNSTAGGGLKVQVQGTGADTKAFEVYKGGTDQVLTINGLGRVGINKGTPQQELSVDGEIGVSNALVHIGDTDTKLEFPSIGNISIEADKNIVIQPAGGVLDIKKHLQTAAWAFDISSPTNINLFASSSFNNGHFSITNGNSEVEIKKHNKNQGMILSGGYQIYEAQASIETTETNEFYSHVFRKPNAVLGGFINSPVGDFVIKNDLYLSSSAPSIRTTAGSVIDFESDLTTKLRGHLKFQPSSLPVAISGSSTDFMKLESGGVVRVVNSLKLGSGTGLDTFQIKNGAGNFMFTLDNQRDLRIDSRDFRIESDTMMLTSSADITLKPNGSTTGGTIKFIDTSSTERFIFNIDSTPELDVSGDFTVDCNGDISLDAAGGQLFLKNSGNTYFQFDLDSTPTLNTNGNFTLDGTGAITIDCGTDATDEINLARGGAIKMFVSSSGATKVMGGSAVSTDTHTGRFIIGAAGASAMYFDANTIQTKDSSQVASHLFLNSYGGDVSLTAINSGKVGIGTGSPSSKLHVETDEANQYVARFFNDGGQTNRLGIMVQCGQDSGMSRAGTLVQFRDGDGTNLGEITFSGGTVSYGPFTGAHKGSYSQGTSSSDYSIGDILVIESCVVSGSYQPDYVIKKSHTAMQKSVFGIYGHNGDHLPDPSDAIIYSLGDGVIKVNSEGGNIEIGDYICSSNTQGVGMKQSDDILRNYTVAKASQNVDWSLESSTTKLIACTYHCG